MSTRSVIAKPVGDGWEGRYHHWDGYPAGVGAELFHLYHNVFGHSVERMRKVLIDQHPAGWSTIIGADWRLAPGYSDRHSMRGICLECGAVEWEHYTQYYKDEALNLDGRPIPEYEPNPSGSALCLGHQPRVEDKVRGPECFCHGGRGESEQLITHDSDDGGTEWAYLLADDAMIVLQRVHGDGTGAVGWFGMPAAEGGGWKHVARVSWLDQVAPDWDELTERAWSEVS
jgi:hypothetical protein